MSNNTYKSLQRVTLPLAGAFLVVSTIGLFFA